jgi:hypothetical protein
MMTGISGDINEEKPKGNGERPTKNLAEIHGSGF